MAYPSGEEPSLWHLKKGGNSWEVQPQARLLNVPLQIWLEH